MAVEKIKVGVLGSGVVGLTMGRAFLIEGYDVMLGTRDPGKDQVVKWKDANPSGKTGSFEEAAQFGEIIVLATAGAVVQAVLRLAGYEHFRNKVVIDITNPIDTNLPPVNGVLRFFTDANDSLMQRIQAIIPEAKLVKAFNSVGNAVMYRPRFKEGRPTMFICGNDDNAKQTVKGIVEAFGWEAEDMGKAEAAGCIEQLCMLWCIPGLTRNEWRHAFKLLKP